MLTTLSSEKLKKIKFHGISYVIKLKFNFLDEAKKFAETEGLKLKNLGKNRCVEENYPMED